MDLPEQWHGLRVIRPSRHDERQPAAEHGYVSSAAYRRLQYHSVVERFSSRARFIPQKKIKLYPFFGWKKTTTWLARAEPEKKLGMP
jgi:hypothetical protein